ncbi:DUF4865 family protein [Streptomyces sp. NPDC002928]|uniref:DUF4865 family protein n=1 Tax=Streptomyces sp. NPDC002928 TaxID=3154440 RepID=UPI0033A76CAA
MHITRQGPAQNFAGTDRLDETAAPEPPSRLRMFNVHFAPGAHTAWHRHPQGQVLLRERGVHGSPVNQYAPFYLWNTMEGMNTFLWGGAFQGLSNDFGRPAVQQWTGLAYEEGAASGSPARFAVRRRPVPDGVLLSEFMAEAVGEVERLAQEDGAVLAAAAVDARRWELAHFFLWEHDAPKADGDVFEVLHMSAPGRGELPRGRQW